MTSTQRSPQRPVRRALFVSPSPVTRRYRPGGAGTPRPGQLTYNRTSGDAIMRERRPRYNGTVYKRRTMRTGDAPMQTRYLSVFMDPFSNASLTPRIPDGKAISSVGLQMQYRLTVSPSGVNTSEIVFLLQPNILTPLVWRAIMSISNGATPPVFTDGPINFGIIADQVTKLRAIDDSGTPAAGTSADPWSGVTRVEQIKADALYKWRVVSQGLHLTLINQSDSNDGWFEASRMNTASFAEQYVIAKAVGAENSLISYPESQYWNLDTSKLTSQPSYTTGRLRDVHNVIFSLNPEGNDHEFNELFGLTPIPTINSTPAQEPAQIYQNGAGVSSSAKLFNRGTFGPDKFMDAIVDQGWDSIAVRCKTRLNNGNGSPSTLLVHVVQNVELVYNDSTQMSRFMTRSVYSPRFSYYSRLKNNYMAAGSNARRSGRA